MTRVRPGDVALAVLVALVVLTIATYRGTGLLR